MLRKNKNILFIVFSTIIHLNILEDYKIINKHINLNGHIYKYNYKSYLKCNVVHIS